MVMKIRLAEWKDYYAVQTSGVMNMMGHPLIFKFMPDGNWQAAFDHFETEGKTTTLEIPNEMKEDKSGHR